MKNIPKKIYLQIDADGETPDDFNELVGISWCSEKINSNDIEFILNEETLGSGNPDCPLCHGSGEYHIGGSFGGPIIVHRCRCGKLDLERT